MKNWPLAARTGRMNPSVIREILKVTEQPHIISFAGGLPAPESFPVEAFNTAYATVMREQPYAALQYAASEGYAPLREWVAQSLPWSVSPDQVLITTGSQQALDLVGKVFIDEGSRIAVQTPSYLGALQAFSIYGPTVCSIPNDPDSGEMQLLMARQCSRPPSSASATATVQAPQSPLAQPSFTAVQRRSSRSTSSKVRSGATSGKACGRWPRTKRRVGGLMRGSIARIRWCGTHAVSAPCGDGGCP